MFPVLSPSAIPLVKAGFFIIAPFDEVRTNHELEIARTTSSVDEIIIL